MELHLYYSKYDLLRVTWGKAITLDSVRQHFEQLIENDHYARSLRIMSSSEVEELAFGLTEENMQLIGDWRRRALARYDSIRTAIYGLEPVPAAYISYFSAFFDAPNSNIRQFTLESEAWNWLVRGQSKPGPKKG